jgi:hypothetical protein
LALVVGIVGAVDVYLVARSIDELLAGAVAVDWVQYVEAAKRVGKPELYEISATYAYRYSPLLALLFGPLSLIGTVGWRLLHVAAAFALPTWPMRIATLASWPFWYDLSTGNVLVFILLAAAWGLRGSAVGAASFLALALLIPRPLMVPLVVWILWKKPEWRMPFVVGLGVEVVAVIAIGSAADWIRTLIAASEDAGLPSNVGPNRFIGTAAWMLIGVPLAAWLTWKGRIGFASLAASPYWLPYYLIMPILELVRWRPPPVRRRQP